jgi:NAD(P)-dependent dehydrogenase (short-subunit alcohol dehydrogenase family)
MREAGATVLITARTRPDRVAPGELFVAADITTAECCLSVANAVADQFGGIDIIIHVVGGSPAPGGGFAALDDSEWQRALDQNLFPAVRLDRARTEDARPRLRRDRSYHIHQSQLPLPESTMAYAAAKAALANYSKGLSKEISPKGIRVVRVSPGWVETEAATRLVERLAHADGTDFATAEKGLMNSLGGIPIGREGLRIGECGMLAEEQ